MGSSLTGRLASVSQQSLVAAEKNPAKKPLRICLLSGAFEYKSDESLVALQKELEKLYHVQCLRCFAPDADHLPGLEQLDEADGMLLFTRRLTIQGEGLERVKKYCLSGRPIVGVRTASHAFQNWLELDKLVLGGNYQGHFASDVETGIHPTEAGKKHPILRDFRPYKTTGGLYKNQGLADDTQLLLTGTIPEHEEPIAWTREIRGGRVFYTSLGHSQDFAQATFRWMLARALAWTMRLEELPRREE